MKPGTVFFTVILLALLSCKKDNGYKKSENGFKFKIIKNNEAGKKIKNGDLLSLKLKIYTSGDSLLFNSDELPADFRVKTGNSQEDGMIQDALKMMKTGDSASFIIPANDFYLKTRKDTLPDFVSEGDSLRFEIKINKKIDQKQLEKEYKQYILKKQAEEKQVLNEYLYAENIKEKPRKSGIYIIKLKSGNGKKAKKGKKVTVNFIGKYINGKIFDSSLSKGKPLTFVLGNEHVIPAWNEAIETMREGDKIMLIAPSETAYGAEGLEDYVPPFTTLVYEIKLIKAE